MLRIQKFSQTIFMHFEKRCKDVICVYVQDSVVNLMEAVDKKSAPAVNKNATVCPHGQRGLETLEEIWSKLPSQVCSQIYTQVENCCQFCKYSGATNVFGCHNSHFVQK